MTYPLIHTRGEPGWSPGLPQVTGKQMSMLQFYAFRLGVRPGFNLLHRSGKLFHQYLVDAYTKVEGNNLKYIREHQKELRSDLYKGLVDFVCEKQIDVVDNFGKMVILPSSFRGGERDMT